MHLWPDQAEWVRQQGKALSTSAAVRLVIDVARGETSPYEDELTDAEREFQEAARFALFLSAERRRKRLEARATELDAFKAEFDRYLEGHRRPFAAVIAWVTSAARRFPALRHSPPAELAEEMGYDFRA